MDLSSTSVWTGVKRSPLSSDHQVSVTFEVLVTAAAVLTDTAGGQLVASFDRYFLFPPSRPFGVPGSNRQVGSTTVSRPERRLTRQMKASMTPHSGLPESWQRFEYYHLRPTPSRCFVLLSIMSISRDQASLRAIWARTRLRHRSTRDLRVRHQPT